ncbi:hypothetical protein HEP75_00214 [Xanthomonas sp. SI]|jgi:hypothetical protein|nr:hypothetical protein HEP75_00214 [Xanthomonas sp. SI]
METREHKRRWLLWVVLLTAVASVDAAAQDQQQQQQQVQMQQQQQQLMQQQLQQIQQLQQQQQPQNSGAPKGLSATYLSCRKQARGGVDQERCIEREQTLQDDRLARVYDRLRYELDGSARARLMEAQYAWEQSNAQARDLDNSLYGGSQAESLQRAEAALWRICARADELEKYLGAAR